MRTIILPAALILLCSPAMVLANADKQLADVADHCNSAAYDTLKPQRKVQGARDLMSKSSEGRKYAKWMKKYLKLLATCQAKPFMPDCKPASKVDNYQTKLKESKDKLEKNMLDNYLCNATLVNKFISDSTSMSQVKSQVQDKVNEFLKVSAKP